MVNNNKQTLLQQKDTEPTFESITKGAGEGGSSGNFIGVSSKSMTFDNIEDTKQEVIIKYQKINETILEIILDNHPDSTTNNGYKWYMALCNGTAGKLYYAEEDAQGGFDNAIYVPVVYDNVTNFGMNETWCGGGKGYILFSAGSKQQLPKHIRLNTTTIENYTIYAGTGSAQLAASSDATAINAAGDNMCADSNGVLHVVYTSADLDLWYANNSGGTWSGYEIRAGTWYDSGIICNSTDALFAYGSSATDIDYWTSLDAGGSFGAPAGTVMDLPTVDSLFETDCVLDKNDVIHCVAVDDSLLYHSAWYDNSTNWDSEQELAGISSGNNAEHCAIDVGSDGETIFIACASSNLNNISIYSSYDNFGSRNELISTSQGAVNTDPSLAMIDMTITPEGFIYISTAQGADLQVYNSTDEITTWNTTWTHKELETQESRGTEIIHTFDREIHILYASDNNFALSEILRDNSTDNFTTYESRTDLTGSPAFDPSIRGSKYPAWNWVNDTLDFLFVNDTGVWYQNYSVVFNPPSADTCTYGGTGAWLITDNCTITDLQDASGEMIIVDSTSGGSLQIASGGEVRCKHLKALKTGIDGRNIVRKLQGGTLRCGLD